MKKLFWLMPYLALVLNAADISGKWIGNIDVSDPSSGTSMNTPVRAEFSQQADSISGTIGRREDEQKESIRNGKVDGKTVSFEVRAPEVLSAMKFVLTLKGDRLEGEMKGALDTGEIAGKVSLTRVQAGGSNH